MKVNPHYLNVGKNSISIENTETKSTLKSIEIETFPTVQPFIKWAGGKRWLAVASEKIKPENWSGKYYEPFLGGGSFFFSLNPQEAIISDLNEELIITYKVIRNKCDKLIKLLQDYPHNKEFYYELRKESPVDKIEIAARFIYLNRTCWNGLYRVNSKGKFNTPFGKIENPTICDEDKLRNASIVLKNAKIKKGDFTKTIADAKANDWVFFDPPYITGHQNNGFLEYNRKLFSWNDQVKLAKKAIKLAKKGINVLVSNADYPKVVELYKGFYYYTTKRRSSIGSLTESRGVVNEAILSSYPLMSIKSVEIK